MIKNHAQIRIPDENKEKHLELEVNWAPKDEKSNDCKLIRAHYPDGTIALFRREHLNAFLFAIGTEENQRDLIPQKLTSIRNYETILGITAHKRIEKGEKINVKVKIPIPIDSQEVVTKLGGKSGIKSKLKI